MPGETREADNGVRGEETMDLEETSSIKDMVDEVQNVVALAWISWNDLVQFFIRSVRRVIYLKDRRVFQVILGQVTEECSGEF